MLTSKKKKILVFVGLALVLSLAALIFVLVSEDEETMLADSAGLQPVPESFTFSGVGSTTRLTRNLRKALSEKLGSGGIENRGIIDLTVQPRGLLKKHFPSLYQLHQQLNSDIGARIEHNITRMTYRYPWKKNTPIQFARLVFSNETGWPLYFRIILKKEGSAIVDTISEKYGVPQKVASESGIGTVLYWEKNGDKLVVSKRKDRFGDPEYHVMFYFVNSLNRLLTVEKTQVESKEAELKNAGKTAF